jgi:hypothetical protein
MILPASYSNGFAPRDGRPLYESLWRGCVGAWNPGLGPTGLTLRDWGPYRSHGTLTNMDAASDWVTSQGSYALEFDGSNDAITTTSLGVNVAKRSISCWFRTSRSLSTSQYMNIIGWGDASIGSACYVAVASDAGGGNPSNAFGVTQFGDSVWYGGVNDGKWRHGAVVNVGTLWSVYVDGVFRVSKTMTTNPASGATVRIGSWPFAAGLGSNGNFDGALSDIAIYNRALVPSEIQLLASRRGIAYELAPRRRSSVAVAGGGFNAAWIPRRSLIVGGGTN